MNLKRIARLGLVPLFVLALVGCAEERAPITRVQPGALDKHFFVGAKIDDAADDPEFYWRNYVVDGSASQSLIGVGSWSGVDRIRWEITEDLLIGRKAYQISKGADDRGAVIGDPNGAIIAAYKIKSHFDIRRTYNPTTGEEGNIIEENTSDRPWSLRESMRVDWSQNLVDNPMWGDMFLGKIFGKIDVTPLAFDETDPAKDDAPHFDAEKGYFDVTNHYSIAPAEAASPFGDGGTVPTCALVGIYTGSATYDCDAQEAVVRSSYLRIDPEGDFEPLENTTAPLDVIGNPGGLGDSLEVGVLTPGQQGWDPGYGYVDKLYHRFAHIHDNWKRSHQDGVTCASADDADGDGTADDCANAKTGYKGAAGSQCDVFVGKCTIPYRDRQIKTIGYWVNKEMPDELQDPLGADGKATSRGAAEDLAHSWDQLMSNAVASAREVECRRTGGDRASCHDQFFAAEKVMLSYGAWLVDQPKETVPALTLCHNPVRSYDRHDTCGETGYRARVGDLRHNFLFYWPHESRAPWGGIADWNADPITGRIVGAAAQIMGRSATYAAAMQRDTLQLAMGDLTATELTDGAPSATYSHYLENGSTPVALSEAELQKRVGAVDAVSAMQKSSAATLAGATVAERYQSLFALKKAASADPLESSTSQLELDAITTPLRGSVYEAQLLDPHWMVGALGLDPSTPMDEAVLNRASPLRGLDSGRISAWRDLVEEKLRLHGVCFLDSEAPITGSVDMAGLAKRFQQKYAGMDSKARGEKIYHDLWIEAFKGIAIHEMGHSLGMLHEFASSWDAPNYNPQYWQLRTREGTAAKSCNGKPRTGTDDTCMGPRYLDPETDDEQGMADESRPGVLYFGNSSVMEYQIERFGETVGLGTYDQHVMNALYGRVLETFDDEAHGGLDPEAQKTFAPRLESQLADEDRVTRSNPKLGGVAAWPTHYTEVARGMKIFDAARDCRDATAEEKAIGEWRIVHGKVCAPPPRDHAAWRDFQSDALPGNSGEAPFWHTRKDAKTGGDQVRWFYRWGTSHNSYFHVNDSDAGADPYEVTVNTVRKFDIGYPFGYFRRQNREYQFQNIPAQVADRYFERIRSYHWLVANSTAYYRQFGKQAFDEIASEDDWHRPGLVAETEMFNFLTRAALMPEPGAYAAGEKRPGQKHALYDVTTGSSKAFTIGIVDGRYIGEEYDSGPSAGGSWDYLHWMKHAGFSTEKTLAMRALTDGRPTLFTISRENFLDGRGVKINFRNDLGPALDRLVGGILSEDWDTVAPFVTAGATPSPTLLDLTAATPTRPSGAKVLFPNLGYKQQLGTLLFVESFSRLNTDMGLVDKMRIWIDGQVGSVNVDPAEQARFRDPATGYTYIARRYGAEIIDGKSVDRGIASRMLEHANQLLVASYQVDKDAGGNPVVDAFGAPVLTLDASGQPVALDPDASEIGALTRYIGLLDAARQIGHKLGYGPLSGGGDDD
jgi:hypothetical protein